MLFFPPSTFDLTVVDSTVLGLVDTDPPLSLHRLNWSARTWFTNWFSAIAICTHSGMSSLHARI